jgi:ribosomal RNA assembly protein
MRTTISEKVIRVMKNKDKLEEALNVRISFRGKEINIEGDGEDEYDAEKVIEAISFGFPLSSALLIKKDNLMFEIIPIKNYTKSKDLKRIRARLIGVEGKTKKTISNLTYCFIEIRDNDVGIIGDPELISGAQNAIISIIKGSKQANVYHNLEKNRPIPVIDLGLRDEEK